MNSFKKVLIIGAGPAGLEAGINLLKQNIPFTILEASNSVGGRVEDLEGFAEFTLGTGAEFVHNMESVHYKHC